MHDARAHLARANTIPWVPMGFDGSGVEMKLLRCGRGDGVVVFLNRFAPGFRAPRHLHVGEVHAYTIAGRWRYLEYDWEACAGDYVYEPAGSTHTLYVPEDNTEPTIVWFAVARGMTFYDDTGDVMMEQDPGSLEALYRAGLELKGFDWPDAILP